MSDTQSSSQTFRLLKRRLTALSVLIGICFLVLMSYLFFLQVINSPEYKQRARAVASRTEAISARRGEIFDRYYDVPLVSNVDSFAVDLIPGDVEADAIEDAFDGLAWLLDMEIDEVRSKVSPRYYRHFNQFEIRSGVSKETVYYLAEHIEDFPGVTWHSKPIRNYQGTGSLAHVLGYVDTITVEEWQLLYNKGYNFNAVIGKSGIEKQYDHLLRGKDGTRIRIVDVQGQQAGGKAASEVPPELGQNVVLTIDRNIQSLSESALGDRKGSVLVLKPSSGEILALVSYPWYDPNVFSSERNKTQYNELALDPESPFLNRAIQSVYPPASIFKIVLTTAIVEENVLPVTKTYNCTGSMAYGDRIFHCWKEIGHGSVDLAMALAKSCDIYFWNAGLEIGVERINRFAKEYGLTESTGIDLPGEAQGFMATPEWKEQTNHMIWLGGDTLNLSIGQGWTLVTPIQIANMVAMVANSGVIYKPHLLKEIRDPESGNIIMESQREVLHRSLVSQDTYRFVQDAMRLVVTGGTAQYVLTQKAVEAAAKTGTGEVGKVDSYHSWFATYAPYETDDPTERVVIVVMVEADEEGYEWWSPKAGNAILQGIFTGQNYKEAADTLNLWYLKNQVGNLD